MTQDQDFQHVTTRGGIHLAVRPARPGDEQLLDALFQHLTPDDLRFRFLSSVRHVAPEQIAAMTHIDHRKTENLLGFDEDKGELVSAAMLACDDRLDRGEVAIVVRRDYKAQGVGWEMLRMVTDYARSRGVGAIESIESRDNHAAIALEREMGFSAEDYPGDATLVLLRRQLQAA
ncbi:MAG: GNAT family N-acetyltransferase [Sphingomonas sp.]